MQMEFWNDLVLRELPDLTDPAMGHLADPAVDLLKEAQTATAPAGHATSVELTAGQPPPA